MAIQSRCKNAENIKSNLETLNSHPYIWRGRVMTSGEEFVVGSM